uniref:Uncharacterized protein n=1 Tax=Oncorhynchus tshawytscha TaxID=74940 RepID=A0AAZ3RRX3_ONCTS
MFKFKVRICVERKVHKKGIAFHLHVLDSGLNSPIVKTAQFHLHVLDSGLNSPIVKTAQFHLHMLDSGLNSPIVKTAQFHLHVLDSGLNSPIMKTAQFHLHVLDSGLNSPIVKTAQFHLHVLDSGLNSPIVKTAQFHLHVLDSGLNSPIVKTAQFHLHVLDSGRNSPHSENSSVPFTRAGLRSEFPHSENSSVSSLEPLPSCKAPIGFEHFHMWLYCSVTNKWCSLYYSVPLSTIRNCAYGLYCCHKLIVVTVTCCFPSLLSVISCEEGKALADSWNAAFMESSAKENQTAVEVFKRTILEAEKMEGGAPQGRTSCSLM